MGQYRVDKHEYLNNGKTIFEVQMLADVYGNRISGANPSGMAVDAFGRMRMSQPYTLFDSYHRYGDNGKITSANSATGATMSHNANAGLIECTLDTSSGAFIKRESSRVFAYQPGKSLQILETFVFPAAKANLRVRYGYFSVENGFFLEQDGTNIYFVRRSSTTGSVVETRVAQADWNMDKLDGTGPSKVVLDLSKAQILFTDIEWLGVGSVRMGFVIDGQYLHCHSFHHANIVTGTYMTTACLPVRAEIENTGATASSSTLKVICATVISEGGMEPRGKVVSQSIPFASQRTLTTAGTLYPVISIRLKDTRSDGIVFPRQLSFFGMTNNSSYIWQVMKGVTLTGANWVSAGNDSSVEYDISASALTNGTVLRTEYVNVAAGAGAAVAQIDPSEIYRYQLERNSFLANDKGTIYTIAATGSSNGDKCVGGIQWEEVT